MTPGCASRRQRWHGSTSAEYQLAWRDDLVDIFVVADSEMSLRSPGLLINDCRPYYAEAKVDFQCLMSNIEQFVQTASRQQAIQKERLCDGGKEQVRETID